MNISTNSASYAPVLPVYPTVGQKPVGLESSDGRKAAVKPIEQISAAGRSALQTRKSEEIATTDTVESNTSAVEPQDQKQVLAQKQDDSRKEEADRQQIQQLAQRDREVRAHEQAHMAAGGAHAGAARYSYEKGPDGVSYAVSGEVPIDTGPASTPQASLEKAQALQRAALAPADPSSQDRRVAARAMQLELQALQQIAEERQDKSRELDSPEKPIVNTEAVGKSTEQGQPANSSGNKSKPEEDETPATRNPYLESKRPGNLLDISA